jgi:hypothetical protein
MTTRATIFLILLAFTALGDADERPWQTIEEVLAVVGNTPILHSDVELARILQLVDRELMEADEPFRRRLLDARIQLEIEFRDLEETGLLYRLELETQRVRQSLIERVGGEEPLGASLLEHGLVWPDVDDVVLRMAAVEAYVQQRLRPRVSVTTEEIEGAYQKLLVDEIAAANEPIPPLSVVRDRLYEILIGRKLNEEIERWLERAASRQEVTRFGG